MEKQKCCEWADCKNKPTHYVVLDGEPYWFCDGNCEDEFYESIKENF